MYQNSEDKMKTNSKTLNKDFYLELHTILYQFTHFASFYF